VQFLTRELYQLLQQQTVRREVAHEAWVAAADARLAHHEAIKPRLPEGMRRFCDTTLHDGVIEAMRWAARDEVVLEIDGRSCPQAPRGRMTLRFRGVRSAEGLDEAVGAGWLYEEAHLHPEAGFDYRVLVGRGTEASELRVVADEVELQVTEPSPDPVVGVDIPFVGEEGMYVWGALDDAGCEMGWIRIAGGLRVPGRPGPTAMEQMKRFARSIGAKVAGEGDSG
jgi:hypothetical protein